MKVVHLAYECAPIYKVGGLGDVVGSLPIALSKMGIDSYVVMPGYNFVKKPDMLPNSRVKVFYIQNKWFENKEINHSAKINSVAFADFAIKTLEFLKKNNIRPDIIHCHDWHAGLIPFLLKKQADPFFENTKTVITIHNIAFQGIFKLKLLDQPETKDLLQYFSSMQKRISYLKLGIEYADFVTTVSPNHALEIKSGKVSFGMREAIRKHKNKFLGILNGIDESVWNPQKDDLIFQKYALNTVCKGKKINKLSLQKELNLCQNEEIPVFGFVARLAMQKGIDLIFPLLSLAQKKRIQIIVLGKGDAKTEKLFLEYQNKVAGGWVSVNIGFDEKLAHKIYAASDFFLMPSRYEPCGLTQIVALKYGSLPIATKVGGLKDTISNGKTGWLFTEFNQDSFITTIDSAIEIWQNQEARHKMIARGMKSDFSWKKSAQEYLRLYSKLLK